MTEVEVKLRIKKTDGADLAVADNVGLINYPIASLFKDVEITLNEQTVTRDSSNNLDRDHGSAVNVHQRCSQQLASGQ